MLKLLLADDEFLVRTAFANTIDWQSNGFEFVGAAANGVEALEMIEQMHPDIVITDLTMPHMGGLELIERVKQKGLSCEFVVLSCHNEFEYVKTALRLGVFDYILKLSMDMNELMEILQRLKAKIISQNGTDTLVTIEELQSGLSEHLDYRVVLFVADLAENKNYNNRLEETVKQSVSHLENAIVFIRNNYVALLLWGGNTSHEEKHQTLLTDKTFFEQLLMNSQAKFGASLRLYIGQCVKGNKALYHSFDTALEAGEQRFFNRKEKLFVYETVQYVDAATARFPMAFPHVKELLEAGIFDGLRGNVLDSIKDFSVSRRFSPDMLRMYFHELLTRIKVSIPRWEEIAEHNLYSQVYEQVRCLEYLEDIQSAVIFFIDTVLEKFYATDQNEIVRAAKKYVHSNLEGNLRVIEVSRYLSVTPDYFSHLFSKETGIRFIDYVNQARIESACRKLRNTNLKIYEVAEQSGFENTNYFVKVFKKNMGKTPIEYRESAVNKL